MYRLRHFNEIYGKCCTTANVDSSITEYSIYDIYPFSYENFIKNIIRLFTPCETAYLKWLYWYVLLLSVLKILNSTREFIAVFGQIKKLFMFRDRQLMHISDRLQLKLRQFVVCFVSMMDAYLVLGILMMKPHFMTPWLNVQFFSLVADTSLYIFDICGGKLTPSWHDLVMFAFIYFNLESVWCLRKIFVHAILTGNTDGYSLL